MGVTQADIQEPVLVEDMALEIGLGIGRPCPFMDLAEARQVFASREITAGSRQFGGVCSRIRQLIVGRRCGEVIQVGVWIVGEPLRRSTGRHALHQSACVENIGANDTGRHRSDIAAVFSAEQVVQRADVELPLVPVGVFQAEIELG